MKIKRSLGFRIFNIVNIAIMIFIALIMVLPYLNVITKAFNDSADAARGGLTFWPRVFTLKNFEMLFLDKTIFNAIFISVLRTVVGVVLNILVQFACAYALSKKAFMGKSFILILFTLPMFLHAGIVPTYVLYSKIGLLNNFWVYILPALFSFSNIIIIRTFIQSSIPYALEESAYIDGASELKIFWRIILPLSLPILATVALWTMVGHWNDYMTTVTYIRNPALHTLQYRMMQLIKESDRQEALIQAMLESGRDISEVQMTVSSESMIAAQIVVTTLPIMCTYPFLQKYFVTGITMGSVKG